MTKQQEFLELYNPSHDRFIRFCHAFTHDEHSAKDLVSETIVKAYENFHLIKKPESFTAYLIGIARRIYFNQRRRQWLFEPLTAKTLEAPGSSKTDLPTEVSQLYEALGLLPTKQREAIILFEITGFSLKEICEIQKSGLSAVKARLRRGRERLRKLLEDPEVSYTKTKSSYDKEIITC